MTIMGDKMACHALVHSMSSSHCFEMILISSPQYIASTLKHFVPGKNTASPTTMIA